VPGPQGPLPVGVGSPTAAVRTMGAPGARPTLGERAGSAASPPKMDPVFLREGIMVLLLGAAEAGRPVVLAMVAREKVGVTTVRAVEIEVSGTAREKVGVTTVRAVEAGVCGGEPPGPNRTLDCLMHLPSMRTYPLLQGFVTLGTQTFCDAFQAVFGSGHQQYPPAPTTREGVTHLHWPSVSRNCPNMASPSCGQGS